MNTLTHRGKPLEELEHNSFGTPDEQTRFTRDQIVQALSAHAILLLQIGGPETDGKTATSEIEVLLRIKDLIKTAAGRDELFMDKQ